MNPTSFLICLPRQTAFFYLDNDTGSDPRRSFRPVVAIKCGSKPVGDETPDVAGAAHVHEHMIFRNGASPGQAIANGHPAEISTHLLPPIIRSITRPRVPIFSTALDIIADALQNTTLIRELAKELQVVMEEWKRGEDSPTSRAATELFA
jgi:zinc protease